MAISIRRVSLTAFAVTYVPFVVLFCLALLLPEVSLEPTRDRALYCFFAAIVLTIPALLLRYLARESEKGRTYWLLCWTWGWICFATHLCYQVFGLGDRPSWAIFLALWWLLDLAVGWLGAFNVGWTRGPRGLLHLAWVVFVALCTLGEPGLSRGLGIALLLTVALAWTLCRVGSQPEPQQA